MKSFFTTFFLNTNVTVMTVSSQYVRLISQELQYLAAADKLHLYKQNYYQCCQAQTLRLFTVCKDNIFLINLLTWLKHKINLRKIKLVYISEPGNVRQSQQSLYMFIELQLCFLCLIKEINLGNGLKSAHN